MSPIPTVPLVSCGTGADLLTQAVCTATGPAGLLVVAVYSFLIAFVLPLPSEIVLLAPLNLSLPDWATLSAIILVSGAGKAAGSVLAFHLGQEVKRSGPVVRWMRRSRFDVVEWSQTRAVALAREFGYVGLALALCVPGFPDTVSIYVFTILERSYWKFALATFVGGTGRLLVTVGAVAGGLAIL